MAKFKGQGMRGWYTEFWREQFTLCGGFHCTLSCQEANEWNRFARTTPEWAAYTEAKRQEKMLLARASGAGPELGQELLVAMTYVDHAEEAMNKVAADWFARLEVERAKATTPETKEADEKKEGQP